MRHACWRTTPFKPTRLRPDTVRSYDFRIALTRCFKKQRLERRFLMKAIASIAVAIATVVTLAACDVKKTAEGNVTVPKYEVEKKQAGDVTLPKYDVTTPDVKVTKEEKTVTVPTVKTEEKVIEVPKVDVTPAKEK
jgi:type IV secretory pathway VirB10-like protein